MTSNKVNVKGKLRYYKTKPSLFHGNLQITILRGNAFQQTRRFNNEIASFFFEIKTKKPNGKQKVNLLFDLNTMFSMFARMAYKNLQEKPKQGFILCALFNFRNL